MEFLNSVNWDTVGKALPALATALVALLGNIKGSKSLREDILQDVEILEKLPNESEPRQAMLDYLTVQIGRLHSEVHFRRELPLLVFSMAATPSLAWAAIWLWQLNQWWAFPISILSWAVALLFLFGVFDSAQLKYRKPNTPKAGKQQEERTTEKVSVQSGG